MSGLEAPIAYKVGSVDVGIPGHTYIDIYMHIRILTYMDIYTYRHRHTLRGGQQTVERRSRGMERTKPGIERIRILPSPTLGKW